MRQIEVRAFEKVQKAVKSRIAAMEAPHPVALPSKRPFGQVAVQGGIHHAKPLHGGLSS